MSSLEPAPSTLTRRPSRSAAMTTFSMEVFDNDVVVPSSLATISPILRVANEIESERPRVAYLCMLLLACMSIMKFYVFGVSMMKLFCLCLWKVGFMRSKRHTGWIKAQAGVV